MIAIRHTLPSRLNKYGLWVKCRPVGMQARAEGRKVGAAVPLSVGEVGPQLPT